ncbi:MAG: hypothetical protein EPN97_00600 [Alphaproteobacteria bacterium]|nr:MAG: hypothetical protein EPN97_00600 [Alphaproteobacteria bacterium]
MKFTIEITDEKQLALIEKMRGKAPAQEFVRQALVAGLKVAELNAKQQDTPVHFAGAKPEFKSLDVAAITAALKDKDPRNPVKLEVSRLVTDYTQRIRAHAKENGNRLPSQLKVNTKVAIERVAFKITAEAISSAVKQANKKAASK